MSDIVIVALITGLCSALPPIILHVLSLFKLKTLTHEMNGMKSALVAGAKREGQLEGHALGVKDEKAVNAEKK